LKMAAEKREKEDVEIVPLECCDDLTVPDEYVRSERRSQLDYTIRKLAVEDRLLLEWVVTDLDPAVIGKFLCIPRDKVNREYEQAVLRLRLRWYRSTGERPRRQAPGRRS
jgi:hypothetical protein